MAFELNAFNCDVAEDGSILLLAAGVFEKHGFDDGDALHGPLIEGGFDPSLSRFKGADEEETLGMAILTEVVSRHVAHLLPAGAIQTHMSLSHNPVRVEDSPAHRAALEGRVIQVSPEELTLVAEDLTAQFKQAAGPSV